MRSPSLRRLLVSTGIVASLSLGATFAAAKPNIDAFASRLATLRSEVEALSTNVEQAKTEQRTRLRSLATQKSDLEFQLQREKRRIAALEAQAEKKREQIAEQTVDADELLPAVNDSMDGLRARVEAGLPFKRAERLEAIDELDAKIEKGLVTPQKASVMLWALVEDELRLGRENGLYRQVVDLSGEEVLVNVARLGMVAMYFKTEDGGVGRVERDGDDWQWVVESGERDRRQIDGLFEAMRKGIRTGYFQLPGPIGRGDR